MALRLDSSNQSPYIDLGNGVRFALDFTEYSDKPSVDKALEELRESPKKKEQSLTELRELLAKDATLNVPLDNEAWLIKHLRPRKYDPAGAYELIKAHSKMKAKKDFIMNYFTIEDLQLALEERLIQVFPNRDRHGRRILFMEIGSKWDNGKISFQKLIRASSIVQHILLYEPLTQLNGIVMITNFDKLSFGHVKEFTPKFAKNILHYGQNCSPVRLKAINIINNASVFNVTYAIFKPFLNEKWRKRIHFHGNQLKDLHEAIGVENLPVWLGGTCEYSEYDGKVFVEYFRQHQSILDELNTYGYREGCE